MGSTVEPVASPIQMPQHLPNLVSDVFAPIGLAEFLEEYWTKEFCWLRGAAGRFAGLLSWADVGHILCEHGHDSAHVKIVKDGRPVPFSQLTHAEELRSGAAPERSLDDVAVAEALRSGATLMINGLDDICRPVRELADGLEQCFHERVRILAFASWTGSPGFVHWDGHEVIVLHIAGKKDWQLFGATRPHPVRNDPRILVEPPCAPIWEQTLEEGDVLYFPRGWWHTARPSHGPTLHLSCMIENRNGLDLLSWLSGRLRESTIMRQDLPRFESAATQARHVGHLRDAVLTALHDGLLEEYFDELNQRARPRPVLDLPDVSAAGSTLDAKTVLVLNSSRVSALRLVAVNGELMLDVNDRRWRFPSDLRPVVERLMTGAPVSLAALHALVEQRSSLDELEPLVREWWVGGLVKRSTGAAAAARP